MLNDSRSLGLQGWPAGMPDGWYSTADAAIAQEIIAGWALIPAALTAPHMVHDPNNGKFRAAFFMGAQTIINSIPDAASLASWAGVYIPGYSNYVRRIFCSLTLGAGIIHEWGHLMDFNPAKIGVAGVGQVADNADLNAMWLKVKAGLPAGLYAKTNRNEWMAELFDGYVRNRAKFALCLNARATTSDPPWLADPNIAPTLAMFQKYYPYTGNSNYTPCYTLGDMPNGGNSLLFVGGESITLTNALVSSSAITSYLWQQQIISGGVVSWTTVGTAATLTTNLPTGLPLNSTVNYAITGTSAAGIGTRTGVCAFQTTSSLAGSSAHDGLYQGLPALAPKQTLLTAGFYGACEWQYRETVQTDPTAGWQSSGVTTATYTPTAASLSVRIRVPSSGSYSNVCVLT